MPAVDVKVPPFPESVQEGTLSAWHKKPGDAVTKNEKIADVETDKIVIDVTAPASGVLGRILKKEGSVVRGNELLGSIDTDGKAVAAAPVPAAAPLPPPAPKPAPAPTPAPAAAPPPRAVSAPAPVPAPAAVEPEPEHVFPEGDYSPAVRRLIKEHKLNPSEIAGHGRSGRLTKADVLRHLEHSPHLNRQFGSDTPDSPRAMVPPAPEQESSPEAADKPERRVKMTRLRARIAERLVEAQRTAAILTTFNEVNMQAVMDLRGRYKEQFEKEHGIKLGFMSFFVKAAVEALAKFPALNASVDGDDIVYHGYFDIGIAVSAPRGLVVPVLRNAEQLSLAEIEQRVADFGARAKDNKLTLDDLSGGTFTLSNGGVFGSLLSTPIINPPQSGILGMHRIQDRPVAENGQVVIRPMMYLALSYDHRIIDGREAVQFLVAVKEAIEDPSRLLLQI